jgi:hypothetical protein
MTTHIHPTQTAEVRELAAVLVCNHASRRHIIMHCAYTIVCMSLWVCHCVYVIVCMSLCVCHCVYTIMHCVNVLIHSSTCCMRGLTQTSEDYVLALAPTLLLRVPRSCFCVCMYVCMYVYMHVCMHVCVCVCVCICLFPAAPDSSILVLCVRVCKYACVYVCVLYDNFMV